jgi:Tat protein translocase TatB subunit
MFDLGIQELVVIFIVALIVFGPKRLPEIGRTLGKAMLEVRKAFQGVKNQMDTEFNLTDKPDITAYPSPLSDKEGKKEALDSPDKESSSPGFTGHPTGSQESGIHAPPGEGASPAAHQNARKEDKVDDR